MYSFFNLFGRWDEWLMPCLDHFTPGNDSIQIVLEAGWAPGPVRLGPENLASTGIRFPDR